MYVSACKTKVINCICFHLYTHVVNIQLYTVKKRLAIFPSPAGMSLTKLSLAGIIKLFLSRESLVSDIPAGDGKIAYLFYSVSRSQIPMNFDTLGTA